MLSVKPAWVAAPSGARHAHFDHYNGLSLPDDDGYRPAFPNARHYLGIRDYNPADFDELNINVYGQSAVVVGRWRAKGVNEGVPFDYAARYVSVWVMDADTWRIVSDQSTEMR